MSSWSFVDYDASLISDLELMHMPLSRSFPEFVEAQDAAYRIASYKGYRSIALIEETTGEKVEVRV